MGKVTTFGRWTSSVALSAENQMLEWEVVHGKDYYGIPRDEVERYREIGIGVILVIDVKGAATIRTRYPNDHLSVFIDAPLDELEVRLRARGRDSEEKIQQRLKSATQEITRRGGVRPHYRQSRVGSGRERPGRTF